MKSDARIRFGSLVLGLVFAAVGCEKKEPSPTENKPAVSPAIVSKVCSANGSGRTLRAARDGSGVVRQVIRSAPPGLADAPPEHFDAVTGEMLGLGVSGMESNPSAESARYAALIAGLTVEREPFGKCP